MEDTIAAISTVVGVSALNIIKVSGSNSIKVVNSIFKGKDLSKVDSHTIHYGFIMDENEQIDEVLVSVFIAPKTYTKEDVVEINCHGGHVSTNKILELILTHGARLAEPGEFIKRAYLNGRVDLVEAESISDIISAKTEVARKIGMKGLTGESSSLVKTLRSELLELIANIEVNIDYPEYEDALVVTDNLLKEKIISMKEKLEDIIKKSENQVMLKNGILVSIIGRPNVGKSSILNRLINEEKAIVTEIEGTTRDIVEGSIVLEGVEVKLVDTAGIRETTDVVESIGVNKSYETISKSDAVLLVLDGSKELTLDDKKLIDSIDLNKTIIVINKSDLDLKLNIKEIDSKNIIYTSASINSGLEELKTKIADMFKLDNINIEDYSYLSNSRQIGLLKESMKIIKDIESSLKESRDVDLIEIDIKMLWDKLGEITGETYKEDLLDEIFSKFCLGK